MPIFEQGYQHWQGRLSGHAWRWWTITAQGVKAQFRNRWTKMVVVVSLGPGLILAAAMILWGLFEQKAGFIMPIIAALPLSDEIKNGPREFRETFWTLAFYFFFNVQLFFGMLLVLFVGQNLISQDLRFNAIPLYFSRPLRRLDYFLGKLGVIGAYVALVMIFPLILAYILGLGFSMELGVLKDTARLFVAGLAFGVVVMVSAGLLMLAISSLSRNTRYVGAMWVGVWLISESIAGVLVGATKAKWGYAVSYTGNLKRLCAAFLNIDAAWEKVALTVKTPRGDRPNLSNLLSQYPWYWSAGVLAGLLGLSLWILSSRVKTLDRLK